MIRFTMLGVLTEPLPFDLLDDIRTFLQSVNEELFDGNVSAMARAIQSDSARLRRSMQDDGRQTVHADVVQAAWTYVLTRYGSHSLHFLPGRLGIVGLATQFFDLENCDDDLASQTSDATPRATDVVGRIRDILRSGGYRFVIPLRGDTAAAERSPGTHLVAVKMERASRPRADDIYVFRLNDSVHIRRIQRMPGYRIRILFRGEPSGARVVDLGDADFEVFGRIWGHYVRTS